MRIWWTSNWPGIVWCFFIPICSWRQANSEACSCCLIGVVLCVLKLFFVFPCNSFDWELYWLMYNIHLFACAGEKTWQWNNPSERCILRWTNYLCSVPTSGNSEAWGRRILQFLAVDCQVNTTLQPKN
jgi:hypothetical protein